jgi:hypothetical protein
MRPRSNNAEQARAGVVNDRLVVAACVSLALILRVFAVWRANDHAPNSATRLFGDEPEYNNLALGLLHGHWFDWPARLPVYPTFVAAIHALTGESYDTLFYVQAVIGALTVIPAYVLGRELLGRTTGLLTAFGVAVHWSLVMYATRELSENLYTPALMIAMIVLVKAVRTPTPARFAGAGALLGVATLIRPTALLFPVALAVALLILWRSWRIALRLAAAFTAAMALLIVPWTINNAVQYHTFLPLSTSVAVLWQGSPAYYELSQHGRTYLSIWQKELNPAERWHPSVITPGPTRGTHCRRSPGTGSDIPRPTGSAEACSVRMRSRRTGHGGRCC